MSGEDGLWRQAEEGDANALLVLADLWEDQGRTEAAGLRSLAENGQLPSRMVDVLSGSTVSLTGDGPADEESFVWYWPDGRLPARAVESMRSRFGKGYWLFDSFSIAVTAAAFGVVSGDGEASDEDA